MVGAEHVEQEKEKAVDGEEAEKGKLNNVTAEMPQRDIPHPLSRPIEQCYCLSEGW